MVVALVLGSLALPAAAGAVPLPAGFFGLDYRPSDPAPQPEMTALNVGVVRQVFDWAGIETSPGSYQLSYYDDYVGTMARQGIGVLPVLFSTPSFRSQRPSRGAKRGFYAPRRARDMGVFATVLVRRYGPGGSFWRENPDIPAVPIRAWQVWNEPNLPGYWPTGPSARSYVHMLRVVGRAIKRADRGAEDVSAGLPQSRLGIGLLTYIRGMYRAGARGAFDQLAISAYGRTAGSVFRGVQRVRRTMNREGDRRTGIWITEVGWATAGPRTGFTTTPLRQARLIGNLLNGLVARRTALKLRGVVYYTWRDQDPATAMRDYWGLHTGLLDAGGSPKPGYFAFRDTAQRIAAARR
jgi:hypothetical protein